VVAVFPDGLQELLTAEHPAGEADRVSSSRNSDGASGTASPLQVTLSPAWSMRSSPYVSVAGPPPSGDGPASRRRSTARILASSTRAWTGLTT
jgi:hypothetical protein